MEDALKKSTEVKEQKITALEAKLKEAHERQQVRSTDTVASGLAV